MIDKLQGHLPVAVLAEIPLIMQKFGIDNRLRLSHFLAQTAHESGNFKLVVENMNYSADGLLKIFGKYFRKADGKTPDAELANKYARKPEMIGSRVYASRMGNGDEASKEGYKFRGRGYIQLTGKDNYKQFSDFIGEDCVANPYLVATKYPLTSAAFFFHKNGLWALCDKGATKNEIIAVTKRVNGGTIGLDDRIHHFEKIHKILA
jgi:putative chitinase